MTTTPNRSDRVLLVDFENVQALELAKLPSDVRVLLVLGAKQPKVLTELWLESRRMGDRFEVVEVKGQAHNAVDFCVAYYLGEYLTKNPAAECVVLSKDKKGFDPLVKHLAEDRGFTVRRVGSHKEAFPVVVAKPALPKDPYARTVELLGREKHRPAKRAGLEGKLKSYFPAMAADARQAILERLLKEGKVAEAAGKVSYAL